MSKQTELDALAHKIALSTAAADIESFSEPIRYSGQRHGTWYNIAYPIEEKGGYEADAVKNAVKYLELLGKLERHPDNKMHVRPKKEPL